MELLRRCDTTLLTVPVKLRITEKFVSPSLGVYSLSLDVPSNYSPTIIAYTVLSGSLPNGSPGIDLYTPLTHPCGAAPTHVMSEYGLGISVMSLGYRTWECRLFIARCRS